MVNSCYYIAEIPTKDNHAGNKARDDINTILSEKKIEEIGSYEYREFRNWIEKILYLFNPKIIVKLIKLFSIKNKKIIIQYPFYCNFILQWILIRCVKNNKTCLIIHDVESLRDFGDWSEKKEVDLFNACWKIVVHNEKMKKALEKINVTTEMINLQLFDYLRDNTSVKQRVLGNELAFAGNLIKSKFLCQNLDSMGLKINLYGPNYDENIINSKCVSYKGSFSPDEIPKSLEGSFGLIWDGNSVNTCDGEFGRYMKYNNPHKLSLYISAQMPVIVWEEAAIADFVLKEGIGFTIKELADISKKIENMSEDTYAMYISNLDRLQKKVVKGDYTKKALMMIEK